MIALVLLVSPLWDLLASADDARATAAAVALAAKPDEAIKLFADRLRPAKADPAQIKKWIAALDDETFATREEAMRSLLYLGKAAQVEIEKALAGSPTQEVRARLAKILEEIPGAVKPPPPPPAPKGGRVSVVNGRIFINGVEVRPVAPLKPVEKPRNMDWVRAARAVGVLEAIGTAEARKRLEALAAGEEGVEPTVRAKEALARLKGKP